jgi:uncharacterized membrane protein YphA (DoxX/SURF4 family)
MESALKSRLLKVLEWVSRIAVAAIFLLAAIPKLLDPVDFAKAITNYRFSLPVIGQDYVYAVAIVLPALELLAALALLYNPTRRSGALVCGLLNVMFIALISQAVIRGLNIDCGCFGNLPASKILAQQVGVEKILEDVLWLAMCAFIWFRSKPQSAMS